MRIGLHTCHHGRQTQNATQNRCHILFDNESANCIQTSNGNAFTVRWNQSDDALQGGGIERQLCTIQLGLAVCRIRTRERCQNTDRNSEIDRFFW